ncbi:O-antigen ligase [Mangrovimonas sp. DI 80]|uniref:O-antigen ligase family protein n=1 Tax=Mangrovimonas sp. DI 80 TaxID=1779330 RepID=UPI000978B244|nr:O-antigen polymerase [Mangrovimonas sp. DI 80]OMP32201.1 hypothetical protein BKM32_03895 [Mangrovimonas sp. DI 80]
MDSVLNYFFDVPLFVLSLMLYCGLLTIPGFFSIKNYKDFLIVLFCFSISFCFNLIKEGFYKESLSDYLFIISFFGSFYLFSDLKHFKPEKKLISFFLICSLFLFLATFAGFDKNIWGNTIGLKTDDIEFSRSYRQGFFRKSHIASYFFTFILLYFFNRFKVNGAHKFKYAFLAIPLVSIIFLTGSRTSIVVILLGLFMYYFKAKFLKYLIALASFLVFVVVFIDKILVLFSNTVVYQYLTIIKTISSNFGRLSRVIIWSSWWQEVRTFGLFDFIFGRGFNSSIEANWKNVSYSIWFHNDFLSISYSYGILPLILYVVLFVNIFKKHKEVIRNNIFIFLAFSSLWLSAFFNGFYYYFTILLLYLFYAMIYEKNEVGDIRY